MLVLSYRFSSIICIEYIYLLRVRIWILCTRRDALLAHERSKAVTSIGFLTAMTPTHNNAIQQPEASAPAPTAIDESPYDTGIVRDVADGPQIRRENANPVTLDLDKAVECLAASLAEEDPNSYNAPTMPWPPFRDSTRIPPGTHFLPPRHTNDGPSSQILHSDMAQDPTPQGLLRLLLLHQVPVERLQVPFNDDNTIPEDLCTSLYCPIKSERESCETLLSFLPIISLYYLYRTQSFQIILCKQLVSIDPTKLMNP